MSLKTIKNKSGQLTVEAVLALVTILGLSIYVSNQFKQNGYLAKFVDGPWKYVDGMAQYGVWGPANRTKSMNPYTTRRVSSKSEAE